MLSDWTDDMAIGHPEIDADHKRIWSMMLHLDDAVRSGQGRDHIAAGAPGR